MRFKWWRNIWWLGLLLGCTHVVQAQFDRDWKIFVVPFSHEDVGFTAPVQTVIEQQSTYLDSVVVYVERYKSNPEAARFRWSTEITWPLANYLETRSPEQIERLMELVREGYVDIGAMHFSLQTDLCGPEELVRSLYFANAIARKYNVPITTAVTNDVPGFTWSLAQILDKAQIPYFSLAMNSFLSDFYRTTDIPNLFYWEAQSGHRTLVWRSIDPNWAYLEGSIWGLYSSLSDMETNFTRVLNELAADGYPYDFVMINAATGDNGPPKPGIVNRVQEWNEKYPNSPMRVSTFTDFFTHVDTSGVTSQIPVLAGDAPTWWSWTFASSATGGHLRSRKAQALLPAAETAASIASTVSTSFDYEQEDLDRAYVNNLLFEDHNLGAIASSGNAPFWELKMGWINDAVDTAEQVLTTGIDSWSGEIETGGSIEIAVFNLQPWLRSEIVRVPVAHPLIESFRAFNIVDNSSGAFVEYQRLSTGEFAFLADSVPPLGYKTFRVAEHTGPIKAPVPLASNVLENDAYRIEVGETGGLTSVFDKEIGREWAVGDGRFNQYRFGSTVPTLTVTSSDSGDVLQRIALEGDAAGSDHYRTEVVLPNGPKRIDFLNLYDKRPAVSSENVDFVFDFDAPSSSLRYEIPFGSVDVFDDELSGFRVKHYASQRWSTISDDAATIVLSSSGPALHAYSSGSFNGKVRFLTSFNNTGTAYRMGIGELEAGFSFTSHSGPADQAFATRAGYNFSQPLMVRVLPPNQSGRLDPVSYSFMTVENATLQLATLKHPIEGGGLVARLYNPSTEPVLATLDFGESDLELTELDPLERPIGTAKRGRVQKVNFGPYEIKTLHLDVDVTSNIENGEFTGDPFRLHGAYPNPFTRSVSIDYENTSPSLIQIRVHDVLGRIVSTLVDERVAPGRHRVEWNGRDGRGSPVAAGVYVVMLEATTRRVVGNRSSKTVIKIQ